MIEIEGSFGEGGGQILRSALTLSLLTQKPFRIRNIRIRRKQPGLRAQHLASVRAAKMVGQARVDGDYFESQDLQFEPQGLVAGDYRIDIGTAGACSLVIQTIFLPLAFADHTSSVTVTGGTHVPWSPTFDYIKMVWMPVMSNLGCPANIEMTTAGFYPMGGGRIQLSIEPNRGMKGLTKMTPSQSQRLHGQSLIVNLPESVGHRQREQMLARLNEDDLPAVIEAGRLDSPGKGSAVFITGVQEPSYFGFSALGERGKRAELVADEAIDRLRAFQQSGAPVDRFLADQLLIPLSIAPEVSRFRIERVSQHFETNVGIVKKFLDVGIELEVSEDGSAGVKLTPGEAG